MDTLGLSLWHSSSIMPLFLSSWGHPSPFPSSSMVHPSFPTVALRGRSGRDIGKGVRRSPLAGPSALPPSRPLSRPPSHPHPSLQSLSPLPQNVQLYLADWGYTTDAARERAMLNPRIRILQLADFACMCQALGAREGEAGEEGR